MSNKKGSMELGVNAIVVLIIALVILGLAIAFVTNLFRSSGEQLGGILSNTELPVHASPTEPIKFETNEIKVKQGKTTTVKVSVYNDGFALATDDVYFDNAYLSCIDSYGVVIPGFELNTPRQKINPGSDAGYLAVLVTPNPNTNTVDPGTYICSVGVVSDSGELKTGQVIVEVTL